MLKLNKISYTTLLIRQEYDEFGIVSSLKVVDWKVCGSICTVSDFSAQKLSPNIEYRTVGTFSKNVAALSSYVKEKGIVWDVVPPQAQA